MANPLRIQNRSKLIDNRARNLFLAIKQDYANGLIQSETDYYYQVYQALQSFYTGIGQPNTQLRLVDGPPVSADYNQTLAEMDIDIQTLYQDIDLLAAALDDGFRQIDIDRQNLDWRLRRLEDKMGLIESKSAQTQEEVIFRESFIDAGKFDQNMVEDLPAYIWTNEGLLTLQPTSAANHTQSATVRILEGNGLPGNTKQVRSIEGTLKFTGEGALRVGLSDILDGNGDTWFEYETFGVSAHTLQETAGLGFAYKEGVKWITDESAPLRLLLEIELPAAQQVNWFSLNPFVPDDKGAAAPEVRQVRVHSGTGHVHDVTNQTELLGQEKVYVFGQQLCKKITVLLEQPVGYETTVGHVFFKELDQQHLSYLDRSRYQSGRRIDGPAPSIEELGLGYDVETQSVIQPEASYVKPEERKEKSSTLLFDEPVPVSDGRNIQVGTEALQAWRYMIGLRDLQVANYQFEASSEYRSMPYESAKEILAVSLEANAHVPDGFPDGEWLSYFITVDDGQTWHRIYPPGTVKAGAKVLYLLNTNMPAGGRIDSFGYLDTSAPVHQVRVRIQMSRPDAVSYYTPIVYDYRLRVITKGDA